MSRAFVRESDGAGGEELPELQVSPHRNLVTPEGRRRIEATVERLQLELSAARASEDLAAVARIQRDLRYWSARHRTAEVVAPNPSADAVRFGATVVIEEPRGSRVEYQIVGEDEADPAAGRISYVSPIARTLIGAAPGDAVALPEGDVRIVGIR